MSENGVYISEEEIDRQAEAELRDEARDLSSSLELAIQDLRVQAGRVEAGGNKLEKIRMDSASLRLKARTVSIPGLSATTHRLDEYLNGIQSFDEGNIDDLQAFSDRISALLEGETFNSENISDVVRALPHHSTFNVEDIEISVFEIILVVPQRVAGKVIARELEACGYRVSTVQDPLDAIALVLEAMPDVVMTVMVMPRMSGADMACALAAMPATKHIPLAIITSLEPDHPDIESLPSSIGIVRRGVGFGDDLVGFLERFNIV